MAATRAPHDIKCVNGPICAAAPTTPIASAKDGSVMLRLTQSSSCLSSESPTKWSPRYHDELPSARALTNDLNRLNVAAVHDAGLLQWQIAVV